MTDEKQHKGNVQAALEELGRRAEIKFLIEDAEEGVRGAAVAIVPQGFEVRSLKHIIDQYAERPDRMTGIVLLSDLESVAAWTNLYKRPETLIFLDDVNPAQPSVHVVIDAHEAKAPEGLLDDEGAPSTAPRPGFSEFGARYFFPLTPEWEAWRGVAGKWLEQRQFAAFIESHILDVADPTDPGERALAIAKQLGLTLAGHAKLLELSRGLGVTVNQEVKNTVNLSTGEGQLIFEEKHVGQGGETVRVPGAFAIAVPVFRGAGTAYRMIVMLRYRVVEKRLRWQLEPHLIDQVFEDALQGAAKELREKTAIPVLRGRPVAGPLPAPGPIRVAKPGVYSRDDEDDD